ncbi:MAG: ectoine/hydroxyectoine ABC transporter ATP-binding protein EhuA [FCB group bacterium]|jgi:polar amino acid transport system ATP-binding protein|nr:ectoine/hydroxyectoine ABC transporter ATP-binding protein EhuA [FCB group bacterium]
MNGAPIIQVRGLSKAYGPLTVLDGIDLDIMPGTKTAIIGPSGSGKSTLLRLLMTLERPDSGTIQVEGDYLWHVRRNGGLEPAKPSHTRSVRSKLGMVFQQFNLFPHMTVLKNVTLAPREVLGLSREEAETRAVELLRLVGLEEKLKAHPAQLSGGQKQRVAIARALAMRPRVMLFDEVTSALDPELVGEVLGVLRELAHCGDMTMLIVTHEMRFAQEIADRVLFFEKGRIVEDNLPNVIFSQPAEDRTREFLRSVLQTA